MSDKETHNDPGHEHITDPGHYVRIWGVLVVLLGISIAGPMVGNLWITVITAFGIAFVKAGLVAKHFMHLNVEKRVVQFILVTCLAFMVLLFGGVAPDVMKHEGQLWTNDAAKANVVNTKKALKSGGGEDDHHDEESSEH